MAQQGETVYVRELQIANRQVMRPAVKEIKCLCSVGCRIHGVTLFAQMQAQSVSCISIVVNHQDAYIFCFALSHQSKILVQSSSLNLSLAQITARRPHSLTLFSQRQPNANRACVMLNPAFMSFDDFRGQGHVNCSLVVDRSKRLVASDGSDSTPFDQHTR